MLSPFPRLFDVLQAISAGNGDGEAQLNARRTLNAGLRIHYDIRWSHPASKV